MIETYSHWPLGSIRPPSGPPAKPKRPVSRGSVNQIEAVPSGPTRQIRGLSSGTYRLPAVSKTRSFHIESIQSPARPLDAGTCEKTSGAAGLLARVETQDPAVHVGDVQLVVRAGVAIEGQAEQTHVGVGRPCR